MIKKPYEISIWEDVLEKIEVTDSETGTVSYVQYYKENKLAVIGSDTMTSKNRAIQPIFSRNVNGVITLTFTMYSWYQDENGELVENPFIGLLVNERKLKLKYDNKWYDLIIKSIIEDSSQKSFSYTAKSLHTNELSKTGFNIELNTELENNQGTILELADVVLKETDWQVDSEGSDIIQQKTEEPLYEVVLKQQIIGINIEKEDETITIPSGKTILGFYSSISNEKPFFQFLYREDGTYEVDDDRIILNSKNYYVDKVSYTNEVPSFASQCTISNSYRGERLVRKDKTIYDPVLEDYVTLYKDSSGKDVYGYTKTEYISPTLLKNFITNYSNFTSTNGWTAQLNSSVEDTIYPPIESVSDLSKVTFVPYLRVHFQNTSSYIYNSGFYDNRSDINEIASGEQYVFRIKYKRYNNGNLYDVANNSGIRARVSEYTLSNGIYTLKNNYFNFTNSFSNSTDGYVYQLASCTQSLSYKDLISKKIGIFLYTSTSSYLDYYIEEIQIFPYKLDGNGTIVLPGSTPNSKVNTIYYYYRPDESITDKEDIKYIYKGNTPSDSFIPQYNESCEKIRSITVSESNRFNILQSLAEIFECWADFIIEHNEETGEILLDSNYKQKKFVRFKNYIGKDNFSGFKYGINLNSISRTLDSDQLVSKIIVKNNTNEFGKDGFCSIARGDDNPIKENFLYNFDYYIKQGLLDFTQVNNDLYLNADSTGYLGYYAKLRTINKDRDKKIEEQSEISNTIIELTAAKQTYEIALGEAEQNLLAAKTEIKRYCGYSYEQLTAANPSEDIKKRLTDSKVKEYIAYIETLKKSISNFTQLLSQSSENLDRYQTQYDDIKEDLENKVVQKKELNKEFYQKYSRFIQEGSWISEDYIDDNLYYLDAESVLYTSAYPRVTYNINVVEISSQEGFENYNFEVGDKTYMEDTEFFGYVNKNGVKTPYQEEIVVTEVRYNLDNVENNQIIVQNYKNQFEDLFQRITATTQAVQYQSGAYERAASVVTPEGEIKPQTLQNSFLNNSIILSNAKDQSIKWGDDGITVTNLLRPNEITRIISGAIILSNNGGETWSAAITGNGINASYISSGQIDVSVINIMGGAFSAFRWDAAGINAYKYSINEVTGEPEYFNFSNFVRFDQYGLYGYKGTEDFIPTSEQDVIDNSDFSLTWSGFKIKSNHDDVTGGDFIKNGYISITSDNDFQVIDGNNIERIKIGLLTNKYGMRLSDSSGLPVMETTDDGQLWLRQHLSVGPTAYEPRTILGTIESYNSAGEVTTDEAEITYSKIFQVRDINEEESIAFYDDGKLVAQKAEIHGTIYATGGKIGNLTIQEIEDSGYSVEIEAEGGNVFKNDIGIKTLTAYLYKGNELVDTIISYQWTKDGNDILGENSKTLTVNATDFDEMAKYGCKIEI